MGILDEAIRQHLDLKRRQGADDDELKRLEDEAFGPPTRPGEPDFPSQVATGPGDEGTNGGAEGSAVEPQAGAEAALAEPPLAPPASEAAPESTETGLESVPSLDLGPETQEAPSGLEESTEPQTPPPVEGETEPASAAEPGEESTSFVDQSGAESLELGEIDLDLEEGLDDVREIAEPDRPTPPEPEPTPEPEPSPPEPEPEPSPPEPPIESLDTVEHQVEDVEEVEKLPDAPPAEDSAPAETPADEDMLEETPEFLRDAPENDELWFEQGEPKDFDFDD